MGNSDRYSVLQEQFVDSPLLQLIKNGLINEGKTKGRRYSDEIKKFALTLHFYSPRAYNFVRKFVPLPNKSLISKWVGSVNGDPGILTPVPQYLKEESEKEDHFKDMGLKRITLQLLLSQASIIPEDFAYILQGSYGYTRRTFIHH